MRIILENICTMCTKYRLNFNIFKIFPCQDFCDFVAKCLYFRCISDVIYGSQLSQWICPSLHLFTCRREEHLFFIILANILLYYNNISLLFILVMCYVRTYRIYFLSENVYHLPRISHLLCTPQSSNHHCTFWFYYNYIFESTHVNLHIFYNIPAG